MTTSSALRSPTPVLADLIPWVWVRDVALVGLFTVVLAASAQVAVPLPGTPVPVTAQTLVVLLFAAAVGPVRAGAGASVYLVAGSVGVPWFAVSSGTTLGYLAGFVAASVLVGQLARRGWTRTWGRAAVSMLVGSLAIYLVGATVLAVLLGVGPVAAVTLGVVPFLVGDAVKVAIAVTLLPGLQRFVER